MNLILAAAAGVCLGLAIGLWINLRKALRLTRELEILKASYNWHIQESQKTDHQKSFVIASLEAELRRERAVRP